MVRKVTKKNQKDKQEVIKNDLLFVQVRAIVRLHIKGHDFSFYILKIMTFYTFKITIICLYVI